MGMYDDVRCEYPLPEATERIQKDVFQTKSFGDGMTGGFMDDYTITAEGALVFHNAVYEIVPEKERPYYGTSEWKNPLLQIAGSMKKVPVSDDIIEHHGIINIYTSDPITDEWFEYAIKFTDGKVSNVTRIYREYGNG